MSIRKIKIEELIDFDRQFQESGFVIGVDEVGRGPVAGCVTAGAVYFPEFDNKDMIEALKYLDDSKKFLSNSKLRKELSDEIKKFAKFSLSYSTVEEIEKYNILQASLLAMKRATEDLLKQLNHDKQVKILVDGKFTIPKLKLSQATIIKGDSKSASIAAASILAKVHRDEEMTRLALEYPHYDWHKNKGYPTKDHIKAIQKHGHCIWHRKTFLKKII